MVGILVAVGLAFLLFLVVVALDESGSEAEPIPGNGYVPDPVWRWKPRSTAKDISLIMVLYVLALVVTYKLGMWQFYTPLSDRQSPPAMTDSSHTR